MTDLVVRRLLIDLETPIARHWAGGDAFRSAYLNALSMSFPVGEQFFIDAVRLGFKALPPGQQARFQAEVQGFVGQEATHRRIHGLFNGHLERLGYENRWAVRAAARIARIREFDVRHHLAVTAAYEHFTAILAEHMLARPEQMAGAEPRLQTMWQWHAAEESEHKSTAFDLYQALGGNYLWRMRWFRIATTYFVIDSLRQTATNLRHDGLLFKWSTWRSGFSFFFGRGGLVRECFKPWRGYFRRDFHPSQQESGRSQQWLREHAGQYTVVGQATV
ncbi:metal-dependent hydrolase [Ideonella sp. BN130291]|uniref:metal-dependent hydrolase n=1 Tax=Ideonella sp. BN130291 TaxID=3112940 RepID=UPI002E268317|nr:metal-dependent hydrolase [Ideonella sp. BN130291]